MKTVRKMVCFVFSFIFLSSLFLTVANATEQPADTLRPAESVFSVLEPLPLEEELPEGDDIFPEETPAGEEVQVPETAMEELTAEEPVQTDGATQVSSVTIWDGEKDGMVPIEMDYTESYSKAFDFLDLLNEVRADYGLYSLKMDASLLEASMLRAAESAIFWHHTRPNGESFLTVNSIAGVEIITKINASPEQALNVWLSLVESGHRGVLLTDYYTHIGVGSVIIDGVSFWAVIGSTKYYDIASAEDYVDRAVTRSLYMKPSYMDGLFTISVKGSTSAMYPGDTAQLAVKYYSDDYGYGFNATVRGLTMYSTDLSVCTVDENGVITCTGPGSASIVAYYEGYMEGAAVFSVTGRGGTTVMVTGPTSLSGVSGRIYPATMSDDAIRADMRKSSSSSALYSASTGATGTEVALTFRDVPHGDYKLAVHSKGGYLILVEGLTVDESASGSIYPMRLYGDIDASGTVDSADALEMFNHVFGKPSILDSTPNAKQDALRRLAADVNRDGVITIRDVTQMLRRINGLSSCFDVIP